MEAYRQESLYVIRLFLDYEISFAECISALDEALDFVSRHPQARNWIRFAPWRGGIAKS